MARTKLIIIVAPPAIDSPKTVALRSRTKMVGVATGQAEFVDGRQIVNDAWLDTLAAVAMAPTSNAPILQQRAGGVMGLSQLPCWSW
jgi:hypothetical protein